MTFYAVMDADEKALRSFNVLAKLGIRFLRLLRSSSLACPLNGNWPRIFGKELATLRHNAVNQNGISLTRCSQTFVSFMGLNFNLL